MRDKDYTPTSIVGSDEVMSSIELANKTWMGPIPPIALPENYSDLS
jgi:hypothetical protein